MNCDEEFKTLHFLINDDDEDPLLSSQSTDLAEDLPSTESSFLSDESSQASITCEFNEGSRLWVPLDSLDTTFLQPVLENNAVNEILLDNMKASDYIEGFVKVNHLTREVACRLTADFAKDDLHSLLTYHPDELWLVNCQYGYEFQRYVQSVIPISCSVFDRRSETSKSSRTKICIHTFCLDLLYNEKYNKTVEWIDEKQLVFKVLNPTEIAKLWKRVKDNRKVDYETFGRGIRFSMKRGFFMKMRPQKKKVYRLTAKALRGYREYRPKLRKY